MSFLPTTLEQYSSESEHPMSYANLGFTNPTTHDMKYDLNEFADKLECYCAIARTTKNVMKYGAPSASASGIGPLKCVYDTGSISQSEDNNYHPIIDILDSFLSKNIGVERTNPKNEFGQSQYSYGRINSEALETKQFMIEFNELLESNIENNVMNFSDGSDNNYINGDKKFTKNLYTNTDGSGRKSLNDLVKIAVEPNDGNSITNSLIFQQTNILTGLTDFIVKAYANAVKKVTETASGSNEIQLVQTNATPATTIFETEIKDIVSNSVHMIDKEIGKISANDPGYKMYFGLVYMNLTNDNTVDAEKHNTFRLTRDVQKKNFIGEYKTKALCFYKQSTTNRDVKAYWEIDTVLKDLGFNVTNPEMSDPCKKILYDLCYLRHYAQFVSSQHETGKSITSGSHISPPNGLYNVDATDTYMTVKTAHRDTVIYICATNIMLYLTANLNFNTPVEKGFKDHNFYVTNQMEVGLARVPNADGVAASCENASYTNEDDCTGASESWVAAKVAPYHVGTYKHYNVGLEGAVGAATLVDELLIDSIGTTADGSQIEYLRKTITKEHDMFFPIDGFSETKQYGDDNKTVNFFKKSDFKTDKQFVPIVMTRTVGQSSAPTHYGEYPLDIVEHQPQSQNDKEFSNGVGIKFGNITDSGKGEFYIVSDENVIINDATHLNNFLQTAPHPMIRLYFHLTLLMEGMANIDVLVNETHKNDETTGTFQSGGQLKKVTELQNDTRKIRKDLDLGTMKNATYSSYHLARRNYFLGILAGVVAYMVVMLYLFSNNSLLPNNENKYLGLVIVSGAIAVSIIGLEIKDTFNDDKKSESFTNAMPGYVKESDVKSMVAKLLGTNNGDTYTSSTKKTQPRGTYMIGYHEDKLSTPPTDKNHLPFYVYKTEKFDSIHDRFWGLAYLYNRDILAKLGSINELFRSKKIGAMFNNMEKHLKVGLTKQQRELTHESLVKNNQLNLTKYDYRLKNFEMNQFNYLVYYLKMLVVVLSLIFVIVGMTMSGNMDKGTSNFYIILLLIVVAVFFLFRRATDSMRKSYEYNEYKFTRKENAPK
jgi:hypothetical protein